MTGSKNTEMDNDQCKLEENSKAVDTCTAAAANSKGSAACQKGISNPVITSSVHVDNEQSDELVTVCGNEHNDGDDEATFAKSSTGQSSSSPSQSAEDNNTIGDNTDEPVQL